MRPHLHLATSGISSDRKKDPRPHLKFENTTVHEIKTSKCTHTQKKRKFRIHPSSLKLQVILNSNAMCTSASNPPIEYKHLFTYHKL